MDQIFDIEYFRGNQGGPDQYERQLSRIRDEGKQVDCIEKTVRSAVENLREAKSRSFVIYGEPQSGKTEMMICLTAKLLDEGFSFVLHLLNDSVDLLGQNLGRFKLSGLAPSAKNYSEILDPTVKVKDGKHVIFCKKNASDLRKLIDKISEIKSIVVIDDEADYASPNAKVNKGEKTRINELIGDILGSTGTYIGVTATPARLDLNNTFQNDSHLWVDFPPHRAYTGQNVFFPIDDSGRYDFSLKLLPDQGDDPKYARQALLRFLVNVAYLNNYVNRSEENYSILVHTSGKKVDHKADWDTIHRTLAILSDDHSERYESYAREIWNHCQSRYADAEPNSLTQYVLNNISRSSIIVLNSERDWNNYGSSATKPTSLFTVIIGGNIVSRGVTLDNLLSMFFTRDVKHKIQQDTYIQRARMFGSRGDYLRFFELTIPEQLYLDWHRCFVFHRLALDAIRDRLGSLVWLSDKRISAVAGSSIDRSTVDLDRGEMAFQLFDYDREIDNIVAGPSSSFEKMEELASVIGDQAFPPYLRRYVLKMCQSRQRYVAFHPSTSIAGYKDGPDIDKQKIERGRGFMGRSDLQRTEFPDAIHHFKVYRNLEGRARLFYKFDGSIQFIKNIIHDTGV